MHHEKGTAEVDGASLYHEVAEEGEPLVLVHAGICDARTWEAQREAFAARRRVILYDKRGFGRTVVRASGRYSHHEDLRGLLDSPGIGRASFVGCSLGGRTVMDFALRYPGRVRGLVLVGPSVSGFEADVDPPEEWEELVAADEAGDLERVSELEVWMWVDGPYRGPERVDASVRDLVQEMNLIALRNEASGLGEERPAEPPTANRPAGIRVPTLVIVGDRDRPEIAARADLLARDVPRVRKVVMEEAAHLPNMERPAQFSLIVSGFLDEVGA